MFNCRDRRRRELFFGSSQVTLEGFWLAPRCPKPSQLLPQMDRVLFKTARGFYFFEKSFVAPARAENYTQAVCHIFLSI